MELLRGKTKNEKMEKEEGEHTINRVYDKSPLLKPFIVATVFPYRSVYYYP